MAVTQKNGVQLLIPTCGRTSLALWKRRRVGQSGPTSWSSESPRHSPAHRCRNGHRGSAGPPGRGIHSHQAASHARRNASCHLEESALTEGGWRCGRRICVERIPVGRRWRFDGRTVFGTANRSCRSRRIRLVRSGPPYIHRAAQHGTAAVRSHLWRGANGGGIGRISGCANRIPSARVVTAVPTVGPLETS